MSKPQGARPLSGEIMDGQRRPGKSAAPHRQPGHVDVIDAEFEAVPPVTPEPAVATRFAEAAPSAAGMDMLRRSAAPEKPAPRRGGPIFYLSGCALAFAAFWISGGHGVMGSTGAATTEASGPLRIAAVDTRVEAGNGRSLLFVDGEIFNPGFREADVPDLAIEVREHSGRTTRYYLGTNDRRVGAGGRFGFSSRVHVPKEGVKSVSVRFRD